VSEGAIGEKPASSVTDRHRAHSQGEEHTTTQPSSSPAAPPASAGRWPSSSIRAAGNVRDPSFPGAAIQVGMARSGRVDVLLDNTGYGA
jgi:hypothetical protein